MAGSAVVVGAGVSGLAAAIGLRRAGWSVQVLERRPALEFR
jgi:phytoene dehydrogenase-like protein